MTLALAGPAAMLVWVMSVLLLLSSPARVCCARCVTSLSEIGHPVVRIQTSDKMRINDAGIECFKAGFLGLLFAIDNMTAEEKALCDSDLLVPMNPPGPDGSLSRQMLTSKDDDAADVPKSIRPPIEVQDLKEDRVPALNLITGRWHFEYWNYEFKCVLCQKPDVVMYLPQRALDDAVEYTGYDTFLLTVTSIEPWASIWAGVRAEELTNASTALTELLQPSWDLNEKRKMYVENGPSYFEGRKLKMEFLMRASILKSVLESSQTLTLLDKYVVSFENRAHCSREETVDAAGVTTVWPLTYLNSHTHKDTFQKAKDSSSSQILRRVCYFDHYSNGGKWSDVSFWQLEWEDCSDDEAYVSEEIYKDFLEEEIRYRKHHQLDRYASGPLNSTELKTVTGIVNRQVDLINNIDDVTALDLINITANLLLGEGEDVCLAQDTRVYVLVAALEGKTPVLGLTVEYDNYTDSEKVSITLDRTQPVKPRSNQHFALAISDGLVKAHKRMMVFVYWMNTPIVNSLVRTELRTEQYIETTVALVLKSGQKDGALSYGRDSDYYVDVTFKANSQRKALYQTVTKCSTWNNLVGRWATEGCHPLKANQGRLTVCRCSAKYFALTDVPGVATARFALNKAYELKLNVTFVAFVGGHTALIVFTVFECLLSALGLCSIVATAIAFKAWRQNTGHQILMHMLLALTCNLVLGFVTAFVQLDTQSVGCVALGVLRHYTFLAMLLWMLVLSGLQRKRLTTVAGAKAVTHLILKASVFAWGIPVLPIAVLLAWDTRFYQQDSFDRGYCYPEGLAFQLTVQAPAGLILLVNFLIFVAIVTHIFECRGGMKITRYGKNETTEQLNKLKTSLFMFFLFGFTWVFHFLSEEHIIDSLFLFEYLFLMTATTHVLVLALFFVVLQESTRKDWLGLLGKLRCGSKPVPVAPVQAARPAYQPQLPKGIANRPKPKKAEKKAAKKNAAV